MQEIKHGSMRMKIFKSFHNSRHDMQKKPIQI